jgi:tetratricopeptide (TPR) repeat protein
LGAKNLKNSFGHVIVVRLCKQQEPNTAQALTLLNTVLRLNPKHSANAYKWRSWAKQRTGDLHGAIQDIEEALTMQPREARYYAIRADLKQQQGDLQSAVDDIGIALQLVASEADTLVYQDIRARYLREKFARDSLAARKKK